MNNIKIIISLILISILISSCSGDAVNNTDLENLGIAIDNTNQYSVYKTGFYVSVSSGSSQTTNEEDKTIMFAQGDMSLDKSQGLLVNGYMTQYVLGESSTVIVTYSDGKYYTNITNEDTKTYTELDKENLLKQFIFADAATFNREQLKSLTVSTDNNKISYQFVLKADNELFKTLLGEDIYTLAGALNPDYEKTQYSDADCKFVVDTSGEKPVLSSLSISFDISVFNKMPYIPGQKLNEKDYKFDISATMRLSYKAFGDDVTITLPDDLDEYIDLHSTDETSEDETDESVDETSAEESAVETIPDVSQS